MQLSLVSVVLFRYRFAEQILGRRIAIRIVARGDENSKFEVLVEEILFFRNCS